MRTRARLSPRRIRKLWLTLGDEEREQAAARQRRGRTSGKFSGGPRPESGRTRDVIGEMAGISGVLAEQCNAIYEAAAREPALFGPVVDYLERTENIHDAHNRMRRVADIARVEGLGPIAGRFATLVFDPPWEDESVSEHQRPPYATMTATAIAALPIERWQLDRGHIYVHAPGPFLALAIGLVHGWGYDFKQVLTYRKSYLSMGRYFRTRDEYCVFGTRGRLMLKRADLQNWFEGAVSEHSEKPEAFYQLVRDASPAPYGEAFQRHARPDFTSLFAPKAAVMEAAE